MKNGLAFSLFCLAFPFSGAHAVEMTTATTDAMGGEVNQLHLGATAHNTMLQAVDAHFNQMLNYTQSGIDNISTCGMKSMLWSQSRKTCIPLVFGGGQEAGGP